MPYGYGSANTGRSSGSSHDRGGRQHQATATRQVAASRARDRHPTTESTGREQAIANTTYGRPDTVTYGGPSRGEGIGSQIFNKNLRTIQRRHDYNRLANQRAHPFLSRLGGIGGLLKGIGRGALGFFGGLPGRALSGIMTAKNWATRTGQNIGEFGETDEEGNPLYPTWDRYINRNTGKYDNKPYLGQGQSNYTFDDQVATNVTTPNLNHITGGTNFNDFQGVNFNNTAVPNNELFTDSNLMAFNTGSPLDLKINQAHNIYNETGFGQNNLEELMKMDIQNKKDTGAPLSLPNSAYTMFGADGGIARLL